MARRPRYQRLGVTLDAPARTDFAGLRETAAAATNISRQIDRMGEFLFKEESRKAEQRGKQLVADMGAQPVLADLASKGGPTNIEQRAAFDSANRIAATEIETAALLEMDSIVSKAVISKPNFADFNEDIDGVVDGMPAALSNLDPTTAGLLRQSLKKSAQKFKNDYLVEYNNEQIRKAQGRAIASIDVRQKEIFRISASQSPDREAEANVKIEQLRSMMSTLKFDPDDIEKIILSTKEQALKESILFDFRQLNTFQEKQDFIAKQKEKLPGIMGSEEAARRFINTMSGEVSQLATGMKGKATALSKEIKSQRNIAIAGHNVRDSKFAELQAKVIGLGEFGQKQMQELEELRVINAGISALRKMPPVVLQAEINRSRTGIPGLGEEGVDTEIEVELLEEADKLLAKMTQRVREDPMSAGVEFGIVKDTPITVMAALTGEAEDAELLRAEVVPRIEAAEAVASHFQVPVTLLSDEEANVLLNTLNEASSTAQLSMLNSIFTAFTQDYAADVFAQLGDKNKTIGHIAGLFYRNNHQFASEALRGIELLKDGYKTPGFIPTETQPIFNEYIGKAFSVQPEALTTGTEIAKAIYAKRAQSRGLEEFDSDLWTDSINAAYGGKDGRGGIQEVFGDKVLLPSGVSVEQIEAALNTITPERLAQVSEGIVLGEDLFNSIFLPEDADDEVDLTDESVSPAPRRTSRFNDDYSIISTGYGTYAIVFGEPGAGGMAAYGQFTDENGAEVDRILEFNLLQLLNLE